MELSHLEQRIRCSYRYITKNKSPDFEDDCVQECLLSFHLKGKGQTVDQAVIDFLRTIGGRKDSVNYETRRSLLNYREIPDSASYIDHHHIPLDFTVNLRGRIKVIVEMYGEGHTFKEIGQHLKITESRVCQLFTNYTTKMQFILGLSKEVRNWAVGHVF